MSKWEWLIASRVLTVTGLCFHRKISTTSLVNVLHTAEIVHFLTDVVTHFSNNLSATGWDFIRIAISSWVLTLSKSSDHYQQPKCAIFISAVYKLFRALYDFIHIQRAKSSTPFLDHVIDEWEQIFAKDVNLIVLKCYMRFIQGGGSCNSDYFKFLFDFKHLSFN